MKVLHARTIRDSVLQARSRRRKTHIQFITLLHNVFQGSQLLREICAVLFCTRRGCVCVLEFAPRSRQVLGELRCACAQRL